MGFTAKITSTDADKAVGGSYSLFTKIARIISPCIIQARTMDGENPATAENSTKIAFIPHNGVNAWYNTTNNKLTEVFLC